MSHHRQYFGVIPHPQPLYPPHPGLFLLRMGELVFKNSEGGLLHSTDVMVVAGLPVYVFRIIFTAPVLYYNLTRLTVAPHFR